ncbi:Flp family type IVb pilin [Govanella unica]|uniref:Flp family type IVb pilin n=1 Tax=Govanella unica TaxID=2975056 RepID=A0A9X3Z8E4_9PROT|nr:Flp family type IVb pilin [Govania unica]MDA5194973.1 Flp family type IVb pilin [Govania unica]
MFTLIKKIRKNEAGATAIEYGLIAALVAIGCIAALTQLGGSLTDTFTNVKSELDTANGK